MIYWEHLATAFLLQTIMVESQFELDIGVVDFSDSVGDCGGGFDICRLYIDKMCLDPQSNHDQSCTLGGLTKDTDLDSDLPRSRSFSVNTKPWPVDFWLSIEIKDRDTLSSDDDIDDLVVSKSLNTSSEFTSEVDYTGDRITLTLQFRVQCMSGYEGPHCDCVPQDNDVNGHYSCLPDGGISCLPGYTNTSDFCRQDHCSGVQCPPNATCVSNVTTYFCQCVKGMDCKPPLPTTVANSTPTSSPPFPANLSPNTTTATTISERECNCENGTVCVEEGGVSSCVCPEGFRGMDCLTPVGTPHVPKPAQSREGSSMSRAAIAGIVTAVLLAVLLSGVLVVVVLCIRLRRKSISAKITQETVGGSSKSQNGGGSIICKMSMSRLSSNNSCLVDNPTYNHVGQETGSDTLRHLKNPIYNDVDNPLYREHPKVDAAGEGIYSVPTQLSAAREEGTSSHPDMPPMSLNGEGGIYSDPDMPPSPLEGEGDVYSYATVAAKDCVTTNGTKNAQPQDGDTTYNTLDHGIQQPHHQWQQHSIITTT